MENTAHKNADKLPLPWLVQVFSLVMWGFLVLSVFFTILVASIFFTVRAVSFLSSGEGGLVFAGVCLSGIWPLTILHGIHTRRASTVVSIRIFCALNAFLLGVVLFLLLLFEASYLPGVLFCAFAFFVCWLFYWAQSTEVLHAFSKPLGKTHTEIPWGIGALRALLLLSASVHVALLFFFSVPVESQGAFVLQFFCLFLLGFVYWQTHFPGCNKYSFFFSLALLVVVLCVANTATFIVFGHPAGYRDMLTFFNVQQLADSLFWLMILAGWRLAVSTEDARWFSHALPEKTAGRFIMRIMTAMTESRACACSLLFFLYVFEMQQRQIFLQVSFADTGGLFLILHVSALVGGVCVFLRTLATRNDDAMYTLCAVFSCLLLVLHGVITWNSAGYLRGSFTSAMFLFWMVFFIIQRGAGMRKEEATPLPVVFFRGGCLFFLAQLCMRCLSLFTYESGWGESWVDFLELPPQSLFFTLGCLAVCLLLLLHQVCRQHVSIRALQVLFVITGGFILCEIVFAAYSPVSHRLGIFVFAASAYFSMSTEVRAWVQKRKSMAEKRKSPAFV